MKTTSRGEAEETRGGRDEDTPHAAGNSRTPELAAPAGASHGCGNVLYCARFIRGPQYNETGTKNQLTKSAHPAGLQGVNHRRPSRNPRAGPFLFSRTRSPPARRRPSSDSSGGGRAQTTERFPGLPFPGRVQRIARPPLMCAPAQPPAPPATARTGRTAGRRPTGWAHTGGELTRPGREPHRPGKRDLPCDQRTPCGDSHAPPPEESEEGLSVVQGDADHRRRRPRPRRAPLGK
jgi:hypothetical protein